MSDAVAEFWRFSLTVYASPGVEPWCLVVQDEFGRDVNIALYCCWLGASGRGRLTPQSLEGVDQEAAPWRAGVVEKLRAARRAIRAAGLGGSDDLYNLYTRTKTLELAAERAQQGRLAALAPPPDPSLTRDRRLADALANLALYLGDIPAEAIRAALSDLAKDNFACP